jgi:ribosomal protein S18 acetylase RimI-like enzyme
MNVRNATEADSDSILKLVNSAFQVESFFKNRDRLDADDLARHFQQGRFLLAEEDGHLAGCIYVTRHDDRAYFGLLSVDPSHQKNGVGRRLVSAAEEFARETGARFMDLKLIHLRTELPGIYEKLGYHICGTEPYPAERSHMLTQPVHFLCMTKELGHR